MKYRIKLTAGVVTQWFQGWRPDLSFVTTNIRAQGWFNEREPAEEMAEKVRKHLSAEWDEATRVTVEPDEQVQLTTEDGEPPRYILRLRREGTSDRYFKGLNDGKQVVLSVGPKSAKVMGVEEATEMAGECLNQLGDSWIVDALSPEGRYLFTVAKNNNKMLDPLFTDEELEQFEKEVGRMTVAQVEQAQELVKAIGDQVDKIKGMLFRALPKKLAQETGKKDEGDGMPIKPKRRGMIKP